MCSRSTGGANAADVAGAPGEASKVADVAGVPGEVSKVVGELAGYVFGPHVMDRQRA